MTKNVIKSQSFIEKEIEKKKKELADLENELAEAELACATLENELSYFQKHYNARFGILLAELDELNAQIAEAIAILSPHDEDIQSKATEARVQAERTFEDAYTFSEDAKSEQQPEKFTPTDEIKKLFREVAKKIHPDLAEDDADRARRNQYMKEANQAYHDGNFGRLREILQEWESDLGVERENHLEVEFERLNRLIEQIKQKTHDIKNKIRQLQESEIGQLKMRADLAERDGQDLLSQIALEIQAEINKKQKHIHKVINHLKELG